MRTLLVTMTLAALVGAGVAPHVAGQVSNDTSLSPRGEAWALEPRELSIDSDRDGFTFTSTRESELGNDVLHGGFDMREATFRFVFEEHREKAPIEMRFNLTFAALVEFRDRNGNGRFELGDEIVQYVQLTDHEGRRVFFTSLPGASPQRATAVYHVQPTGTFEVTFTLAERPVEENARVVRPTQVAVDMDMHDFPFRSSDTMLALETRTETNRDGELRTGRWSGLYYPFGAREGMYRWQPIATSGATPKVVGVTALQFHTPSTSPAHAFGDTVVLAYPQSNAIVHGFDLGVRAERASAVQEVLDVIPGDWRIFLLGILLTLGIIGGAAVMRARDRGSPGSVRES